MINTNLSVLFIMEQIGRFWGNFFVTNIIFSLLLSSWAIPWWNSTMKEINLNQYLVILGLSAQAALYVPTFFYLVFPCPIERKMKKSIPFHTLCFYALGNHGILSSLMGCLLLALFYDFPGETQATISFGTLFLQFTICALLGDFLFFTLHKVFHCIPKLYQFHKLHHQVIHPEALTTFYVHPLEHLLVNVLPILLGPLILQTHPFVTLIWISLSILSAVHNHSGTQYHYLPSVIFHDWHHSHKDENFGISGLFDLIVGFLFG